MARRIDIAEVGEVAEGDRALVEVRNLVVEFGTGRTATRAIEEVHLSVRAKSFTAIVGPSGCGKSTLLHVLAGLRAPSAGTVMFAGGKRPRIGYVFQQDSLLPWRSAQSNVALALRLNGTSKADAARRAREALRHFGLEGFEDHKPGQLSGGMRKRVALACALSYGPQLLLMDEPYSSLDAQARLLLQDELLLAWAESGTTIVFVTHDLEEAVCVADEVVIMSRRPGTVMKKVRVGLARPRTVMEARADPRFASTVTALWGLLRSQVSLGSAE